MTKVLVVDDVEANLIAMQALLERPGIEPVLVGSGADALDALLREEFAVAIIDVQMPGIDGFELARLIRGRSSTRELPIIFVTASDGSHERTLRGYTSGAVDFLHKPVDPDILRRKVDVFVLLGEQRARLARQVEENARLLRLHETFVAALGHDLRTPLQSILVNAGLVGRAAPGGAATDAARRIRIGALRMERMIAQLLDVARARSGGITLRVEPGDLGALVDAAVGAVRSTSADADVSVEATGRADGLWDLERIAQVVDNLLSNAVRHRTPGTPVHVSIDGADAHAVRLTIANAGVIPPEALPTLFEPFRRPPAAAGSPGGTREGLGLGLFIVHHLTTLHGGSVEVDSTAGSGTRVVVSLPRRPPSATAVRPRQGEAPGVVR